MKNKRILYVVASALVLFSGCKYDDDWLNPTDVPPMAYFASALSYERTVIPGEGLQFGIGPALAGDIKRKNDQTVDLVIVKNVVDISSTRKLLPDDFYNSSELGGNIRVTIPKGELFDFFYVKLDSVKFLNDAKAMIGSSPLYALPVRIVGTSVDTINADRDEVLVAIRYQASFDGWYLHETTIENENGVKIASEKSWAEADNQSWRLETRGPFTVIATPPVTSFNNGLNFKLTVQGNSVSFEQVDGEPLVEAIAGKTNSYDWTTRDFQLNFKYTKPDDETVYHVSTKLTFRNRVIDGINQPRAHLIY